MLSQFIQKNSKVYDITILVFSSIIVVLCISLILVQFVPVSPWAIKGALGSDVSISEVSPATMITGTTGSYTSVNMANIVLANAAIDARKGQGMGLIICSALTLTMSLIVVILMSVKVAHYASQDNNGFQLQGQGGSSYSYSNNNSNGRCPTIIIGRDEDCISRGGHFSSTNV